MQANDLRDVETTHLTDQILFRAHRCHTTRNTAQKSECTRDTCQDILRDEISPALADAITNSFQMPSITQKNDPNGSAEQKATNLRQRKGSAGFSLARLV